MTRPSTDAHCPGQSSALLNRTLPTTPKMLNKVPEITLFF